MLKPLRIDHDSPTPLHYQVEHLLRGMLGERRYQEGELLPPEAKMAQELGVSRSTVRAAISRLVQEGLLERKAGLGTRYIKQAVKTDLAGWPSFSLEMERKGVSVDVFSLSAEQLVPDPATARALRITPASQKKKIVKMSRVRGHGGIPSVYSVSWFHPRSKLTVDDDFSKPLYGLIRERSGLSVACSHEEISAQVADDKLAELLCCEPGDPVLVRQRIVETAAKQVVEFNMNYYRADRFTYGLTLNVQSP